MSPEQYASALLTDAYDDIHRATKDIEVLMTIADAMGRMRDKMGTGECFFVRIECTGSRYFKATYHVEDVEGDVDEGHVVFLNEFDPYDRDTVAPPVR
jgi:hypothetical protein